MMLRDILEAEATPIFSDTGVMSKPNVRKRSASASAWRPPTNIGTARPYGGTEVMTPASTYLQPAPSISAAAFCSVLGEAKLRSGNTVPGRIARDLLRHGERV